MDSDSEPLPRSQRLEKEKGAKKRAMKGFLFSRKGNMPRDLVNIKPEGQVQEDETEQKSVGVCSYLCTRMDVCARMSKCVISILLGGWIMFHPRRFKKVTERL